MGKHLRVPLAAAVALSFTMFTGVAVRANKVSTKSGVVEGSTSADGKIQVFKGIPFAAPPVGDLRWREPQPVAKWSGVKKATEFGARCMQWNVYDDMIFRDSGPSEDCLYLNVWSPDATGKAKLPVMVWVHGGGFQGGASSEPRQEGEKLAQKGVVVVSMNYRLGIFGFYTHPELTQESSHRASGNYGLLDQAAALNWVHDNIAAFGGDPGNVTIFGESAGSFSVSALMASPLSRKLIHGAIGESGASFGHTLRTQPQSELDPRNVKFAETIGAKSLKELRAIPAQQLLDQVRKQKGDFHFSLSIDGYFLPESVADIFSKGQQAHVPLLAGWNRDEENAHAFFGDKPQTKENFVAIIREKSGDKSEQFLKLLPAATDAEAKQSAGLLATADFIASGTWKWMEMQLKTGNAPVYRYRFDQAPPVHAAEGDEEGPGMAYHSAEIEYVFNVLDSKKLAWRPEDYAVSELMGNYWTNFAKTKNPNSAGLPQWPAYSSKDGHQVMYLSASSKAAADSQRDVYVLFDEMADKPKPKE